MNYPEPNRAGSHGTSGVGVIIVLNDRYVSLITCCSADDDAVGARVVLRRLRGVSRITRVGVDKAGFNRLLVPYQHPLLSTNHPSSSRSTIMPRVNNTYIVPFEPVRDGPGEFSFARERFNIQQFVKKRGSRTASYPSFVNVYQRSEHCVAESDSFEDLQLHDFVEANKRWSRAPAHVCTVAYSSS